MNAAYDVAPDLVDPSESFKMPGGIVRRSFCAISGLLPSEACSKAGLVETDLFNAKFVPTKVDDSLGNGKLVRIGDKKYMALDSTPGEFTEPGMVVNPDYIQKLFGIKANLSTLIPNKERWKSILTSADQLKDNGKAPAAPSIKASGQTITWGAHPEKDVIGYRVYSGGKKVATIKAGSSLNYKAGSGSIHVTAVDIAGKESASSNVVEIGQKTEKEKPKEEKPKEEKPKEEKPKDPPAEEKPDAEKPSEPGDGEETN